jgi:hypothetical protein
MRSLLVAAALIVAAPALAAEAPASSPPPAQKRAVAMHYPTLEKMLRRFSRQAGESRTRG